jgi:hypothetical protein
VGENELERIFAWWFQGVISFVFLRVKRYATTIISAASCSNSGYGIFGRANVFGCKRRETILVHSMPWMKMRMHGLCGKQFGAPLLCQLLSAPSHSLHD